MSLILEIALRKHKPSEETPVFYQTRVVREKVIRGHREVAPEYGKHAWKDSSAFASGVSVQEKSAVR